MQTRPPLRRAKAATLQWIFMATSLCALPGCAVLTVADAAVSVVATGVKVTAKAVGSVANAVIP